MQVDRDDELERIAEAVSDRRRIDWETEKSSHPIEAPIFEELRAVESVAAVHREAGATAEGVRSPPGVG